MHFSEIVAPTVKELFINRIESSILSGALAVGEQLPSERELAEQMKISKTAVHSGIADMARKGFLKVIPRKGIFVDDYASNGTLEVLISIMKHDSGQLDGRNIRSLLEVRSAIESVAAARVAELKNPEVIKQLTMIADRAGELAAEEHTDYVQLAEQFFRFHHYLCVASGNIIVPLIINAFHAPAVQMWTNSARALGVRESVSRLYRLIEYLGQGDSEAACKYIQWICSTAEGLVRE